MVKLGTILASLSAAFAYATPVTEHQNHRIEDIQCRCLTFSTSERPAPCNFFDSKGFSWRSAQTLASQYDIQIQFASKSSISKLLSIPTPLPNELLRVVSLGDVQSVPSEVEASGSQNKIVCGFGREVRQMSPDGEYDGEGHFVAQVIAWLMLLIIGYAAGEYIWARCVSCRRVIKLKGEEKPLKA